jgi:hypothetical protein
MSVIEVTEDRSHPTTGAGRRAAADPEAVIDVSELRMSYDGLEAVRGIDLHVTRREVSPSLRWPF